MKLLHVIKSFKTSFLLKYLYYCILNITEICNVTDHDIYIDHSILGDMLLINHFVKYYKLRDHEDFCLKELASFIHDSNLIEMIKESFEF